MCLQKLRHHKQFGILTTCHCIDSTQRGFAHWVGTAARCKGDPGVHTVCTLTTAVQLCPKSDLYTQVEPGVHTVCSHNSCSVVS